MLLTTGDTPSLDYFVFPALAERGCAVVAAGDTRQPPPATISPEINALVIVRYLPAKWVTLVQAFRESGRAVVYFMDDDLMDPAALISLPADYRARIVHDSVRQRPWIEALASEFWVSTDYLAEKYRTWTPQRLDPHPVSGHYANEPFTWCYHGTTSHRAEIEWLLPIVREIQEDLPHACFEIFGDHAVNRLYREIPRVSVVHPMRWPDYRAWSSLVRRDVFVVPLLDSPFNAARGPTKFFDCARLGAAGLYADVPPYRGYVKPDVDGLLLTPDNRASWTSSVRALARDARLRLSLANAARLRTQTTGH